MVVQHNIAAMNANRYYNINNQGLSKSLEKLSSGYQINRAGDNAAGLAVSEKMRSQIGGLTQGVKNAQDGISMIQTFEGALTETDSILQRMKVLADQAANGTYQNDVDREAIQLEFDQLNDELNQIADTDFNGVVMLNGGQMADGVKAVNGKFDYANGDRAAKALAPADTNGLDSQRMDDKKAVGDSKYTMANAFWKDLGFDRNDADLGNDGPDSVDITFQYDASQQTWKAISGTNGADYTAVKTNKNALNGGFQIGSATSTNTLNSTTPGVASTNALANVLVDGSTLVNGDTITITFKNPKVKNTAIENIGVTTVDNSGLTASTGAGTVQKDANLKVEITNTVIESTNNNQTTAMSEEVDNLFKALDGATVEVNYTSANLTTADMKITYTDPTSGNIVNFTVTAGQGTATLNVGSKNFQVFYNGHKMEIKNGTDPLLEISDNNGTAAEKAGSSGKITYKLALNEHKFAKDSTPSAEIAIPAGVVSKPNGYNQASAPLTYSEDLSLQAGARTKDLVKFTFAYKSEGLGGLKANLDCSSREGGLNTASLSLLTQKDANYAIDRIDNAINKVSMIRATFGATQNRLEHKIDNMNVTKENITSAESRIRDTDINEEMANFTKNQILSQASQSMLAQANSLPQNVLQLLG